MTDTSIEWTRGDDGSPGATWNPVSGCSKVSQGCKHCYAERVFPRAYSRDRVDMPHDPDAESWPVRARKFTDVVMHHDRLDQPLRWRRPRRVFVNSMSDLFHEDVPDSFIDAVFAVMALAGQHTFQILTKRPERMRAYLQNEWVGFRQREQMQLMRPTSVLDVSYPLPNVWLGVSVEDQETADERIPLLLQTPAAVRFISAEPLLGAVDLERWLDPTGVECPDICPDRHYVKQTEIHTAEHPTESIPLCPDCGAVATWMGYDTGLDWVIVGGESGPKARPCDVEWIRGIVGQCKGAGVSVFVKQLGARTTGWCFGNCDSEGNDCSTTGFSSTPIGCQSFEASEGAECPDGRCCMRRDRKGGDPTEWPDDLRVREFPA